MNRKYKILVCGCYLTAYSNFFNEVNLFSSISFNCDCDTYGSHTFFILNNYRNCLVITLDNPEYSLDLPLLVGIYIYFFAIARLMKLF